jgi:hypothetical protein
MNPDQQSSFQKLLHEIVPWYRPCSILKTTIAAEDIPGVEQLAGSLTNWPNADAVATVEQLIDENATPEELTLEPQTLHVDLIEKIPENVAPETTVLAFAIPLITKENRVAMILYYSNGPRCIRPCWSIAALGKPSTKEHWEILVQYRPGFAGRI